MYEVLLTFGLISFASCSIPPKNNRTFPETFVFGVGTSAYQIEGAWDKDGKGENIWDRWIHTHPSRIKNNGTADVAADSYHKTFSDISYAADLGVTHYSFSISWSRILPSGMDTSVNVKAIVHYQELIQFATYLNLTPVVTLYYHDLPQSLQDIGGWTNPEMVTYFVRYAKVIFQYFSDVKYWLTFGNPRVMCRMGYGLGIHAPGIALDGIGDYLCSYVVLKAHAAVYHLYKKQFPALEGKMSIALDMECSTPATNSSADIQAAERRNLFEFGLFGHPIFIGNWPQEVIDRVSNRSKNENFKRSRLPEFSPEEIGDIKGTADFMAVNTYTIKLVSNAEEAEYGEPSYMKDMKVNLSIDPGWVNASNGDALASYAIRDVLVWLKTVYDDPEIFITENGVADNSRGDDRTRVNFLTEYLAAVLDAMYYNNVRVFGYIARSLMDGFEWHEGYSQRYGLYYIDFSNNYRFRIPKDSARLYKEVATTFRIPEPTYSTPSTTVPTTSTTEGSASTMVLYPSLLLFAIYLCLFSV